MRPSRAADIGNKSKNTHPTPTSLGLDALLSLGFLAIVQQCAGCISDYLASLANGQINLTFYLGGKACSAATRQRRKSHRPSNE